MESGMFQSSLCSITLICLICILTIIVEASGLTCLTCSQISMPRECKRVVHCSETENCYMEKMVYPDGNTYYNLGCRDVKLCHDNIPLVPNLGKRSANKTCDACCHDRDLCNAVGCDALDYPSKSNRGSICYNCHVMSTSTSCNTIETCGRDEECMITSSSSHMSSEQYYTTSCGRSVVCKALSLFGRKRSALCHQCCTDDLCNFGNC